MITIEKEEIINKYGKKSAVLIKRREFDKIESYIEDLEDSLELAEAIKNASGFRLWEEFVTEYNNRTK